MTAGCQYSWEHLVLTFINLLNTKLSFDIKVRFVKHTITQARHEIIEAVKSVWSIVEKWRRWFERMSHEPIDNYLLRPTLKTGLAVNNDYCRVHLMVKSVHFINISLFNDCGCSFELKWRDYLMTQIEVSGLISSDYWMSKSDLVKKRRETVRETVNFYLQTNAKKTLKLPFVTVAVTT